MKVWVTGAEGLLGRALMTRLSRGGVEHVGSGREIDVTDGEAVMRFASAERPSHIINCAAFTRVDEAERDEAAAMACNAGGPENLGRAAAEIGANVLQLSTDYVFDGAACTPYPEDAPTGPLSVYGRSKLAGEERLLATVAGDDLQTAESRRLLVLRSSWLFSERGRSFVTTMLRLMRAERRVEVVSDQHGCPTYVADLARAALELAGVEPAGGENAAPAPSGIYHYANAGMISWHGLAEAILELGKARGWSLICNEIAEISSAESQRPAPRPAYSALDTRRITPYLSAPPRPWREALADCLTKMEATG